VHTTIQYGPRNCASSVARVWSGRLQLDVSFGTGPAGWSSQIWVAASASHHYKRGMGMPVLLRLTLS